MWSILDNPFGRKYVLSSMTDAWKNHRDAIRRDLALFPGSIVHAGGDTVECWCQGHAHDIAPSLMIQVQADGIAILDMGAGSEKVWPEIERWIAHWREFHDPGLTLRAVSEET